MKTTKNLSSTAKYKIRVLPLDQLVRFENRDIIVISTITSYNHQINNGLFPLLLF
jgi:hypothetical protein